MEQDKLSNRTEKLQLDIDVRQKRRTFEQYKRLLDEDLISKEEYLKAQEDFQLASEKRKLVCERLRQDSIYRSIQISQLESDLQNMRLSLDLIRQRRDKLTVCASADGELGQMSLELGQTIASGQMIGRINVVNGHKMEADIDEHYIDRIATGLTGTMERGKSTYQVMVCASLSRTCATLNSASTCSLWATFLPICATGRQTMSTCASAKPSRR